MALSSINAPRLGRKTAQEEVRDEAWAWESREFLRKLIAGKEVFFCSEKAANSNREYAKIFLDKGVLNLILHVFYDYSSYLAVRVVQQ